MRSPPCEIVPCYSYCPRPRPFRLKLSLRERLSYGTVLHLHALYLTRAENFEEGIINHRLL